MIIADMSSPLHTNLADAGTQGALRLTDWGVIRAQGAEAESFLQGQLTHDVVGLRSGEARLAGYCSAKGRLLATFVVWRDEQGDFLLACSADLLASTLKRLSMFVLRAKCKLSDATAQLPLWGLAGAAAMAALGDGAPRRVWQQSSQTSQTSDKTTAAGDARVIRLPDARVVGQPVPRLLWAGTGAPPALPPLHESTWRWLEVMSGTARIVAATAEHFVPQMVNLELVGGVSFSKGCYPGQEVVARSQYRGTLKRRAYVLSAGADSPLLPAQEVFHDADPGQPAGKVILGGEYAGQCAGLVELKIAATEGGALHLGSTDGPRLMLGALPYELASTAA